jgi:hypothetical protein
MPRLRDVAAYLYEQERIDGDEFEAVMAGTLRPADVDGWRAASSSPRSWDAIPTTFEEPAPRVIVVPAPVLAASESADRPAFPPVQVTLPLPAADPLPPVRVPTRRLGRRLIANRRFPAMPARLRRSVAAIVRDLAADTEP